MWSTVFIIFIYLLAYLSCPLFIKGWFIILQKRLRANKCESFPTVCQRFFYTGISSNSGETIYSIWKKYLYPQYWISVNPLLYLFFYCQCISVFMIFSAKEEEDNLYLYIFSKSETIYRESFLYGCTRSTHSYHHSFYIENKCHICLNVLFNDTNISLGKLVPHLLAHLYQLSKFCQLGVLLRWQLIHKCFCFRLTRWDRRSRLFSLPFFFFSSTHYLCDTITHRISSDLVGPFFTTLTFSTTIFVSFSLLEYIPNLFFWDHLDLFHDPFDLSLRSVTN